MKTRLTILVLLVALFVPQLAAAAPSVRTISLAERPTALVVTSDGRSLVSHGEGYTATALQSDGRATSFNVGALPLAPLFDEGLGRGFVLSQAEQRLNVIAWAADSAPASLEATLDLGAQPSTAALDPARHLLYVGLQPNLLAIIDAAALQEIARVEIGWNPKALSVDSARGRVAALSFDDSTVTWRYSAGPVLGQVFVGFETKRFKGVDVRPGTGEGGPDVRSEWETIRVQTMPNSVMIDSASGIAWVLNEMNSELVGVDLEGEHLLRYRVGVNPRSLIALNGVAYVANWGDNTLNLIQLADGSTSDILVGYAPSALALDGARARLYVAEAGRNSLGIISLDGLRYEHVAVGRAPQALALNPSDGSLFVANRGASSLSIVSLP
jgi:DNA-binding beta-propeller fold protein YncE